MHPSASAEWNARPARHAWLSASAVAVAVTLALAAVVPVTTTASDMQFYQDLAAGRAVPRPFAYRILAPRLAAALASGVHQPLAWGFRSLGIASLGVLVFCLAVPLLQSDRGSWRSRCTILAGMLVTPVLPMLWSDLYLPDLLHAALTATYLLLLRARRWRTAAVLLPVLFLVRESTIVLAIVAVVVLGRLAGRGAALLHAALAAVGWVCSQRAGAAGLPNERGIGNALYLLGKVPHNLLKNVLGTSLWTEPMDGPRPAYLWTVPPGLHLGHIHQMGLIGTGADLAWATFLTALTSFGIGAAMALLVWENRAHLWSLLRDEPWLCVAAVYGLISFVLAPALGPSVDRLFAYGWPLFLLALPSLLVNVMARRIPVIVALVLLLLQAGLGWLPGLVPRARPSLPILNFYPHFLPLLGAVVCLGAAADLLRPYTQAALAPPAGNALSPAPGRSLS